jgi:hypothetical protein
MVHRIHPLLCLLFVSTTVVGCAPADELALETASAVALPPPAVDPPAQQAAKAAAVPDVAEAAAASRAIAQFSPPFPDRLDLFEPRQRAQGTFRRDDEGETVELKGFINVDEPSVVLAIDGVISPITEGQEKYGVQVISIQPPSVVLQRGRNRWTATLE